MTNQADNVDRPARHPRGTQIGRYLDWKEKAATTTDGAVLGLGTDIGPMGSATAPTCSRQAGLPTDPASSPRRCSTWDDYLALGEKFKAAAPAGTAWTDSAGGLYNAIVSTEQKIYYDASGNARLRDNPAVKQAFDTAAKAGQAGLTAKLEQFVDPGWDAGFGTGTFATIACPSWMIGYIKGKAGDAGAGKWNVTALPGGAGGNWGGSYLAIPAASPHKEQAAEADHLAHRPRAAGQAVHARSATSRPPRGAHREVAAPPTRTSTAPRSARSSATSREAAPVQILGTDDGVVKNAMTKALQSRRDQRRRRTTPGPTPGRHVENQVG